MGEVTVVVDERIAERRREVRSDRRRRRLRRTLIGAVLLAVLTAAVVVEQSDLVALEEVRVTGVERLEAEDVRAAAALELGTSTLRLRLGAAEERVERMPLVLRAEARREDPLTVVIEVVERRPIAVVSGRGGSVLIDGSGLVIDRGAHPELPRIELAGETPAPGVDSGGDARLAAAFEVLTGLPGPLRAEVSRYRVDEGGELTLLLLRGTRVRFGPPDRVQEKARALGAVLEDVGATPIRLIDVRAPSTPTVRG